MENEDTLTVLVENIFSQNAPRRTNDIQPTSADWAVINKTIYSELKSRVNNAAFSTFPYLGRSIMGAIEKKLIQKAAEFESGGGDRSLSIPQINQIVGPIVDSIIDFVRNLGRGLRSPKM